MSTEGKCRACGSTTHQCSTHRDCPFHKKVCDTDVSSRLEEDDQVSENSDVVGVSEDSLTDEEGFSLERCTASSDSDWKTTSSDIHVVSVHVEQSVEHTRKTAP